MNTTFKSPSIDEWKRMPVISRYQHFTRRKFQEMENVYYSYVDELVQKLDDIDEIESKWVPDFTLHTFSFLKEWQHGDVNTEYVYELLSRMNLPSVAEKTVCRRLRNFMHGREKSNPQSYEYIKAVHDQLLVKCVPLYLKYLEMLIKYFEKMTLIDKAQIRLTWIEQIWKKNGEVSSRAREITLNQMFRELDSNVIPHNDHKYIVGDNVIVFDEDLSDDDTACHWIFGPKAYISQLREQFKVTETIDLAEEKDYIKKLVGSFIV